MNLIHSMKQAVIASAIATTSFFSISTEAAAQQGNAHLLSLKLELENGIRTGNAYLKSKMHEDGYWKEPQVPAYTSLAISAAMRDPNREGTPAHIQTSYKWLLDQQKDTGAIYGKGYATYGTATGIMALVASGDKAHHQAIVNARAFLISQQHNFKGNKLQEKHDGGIGYGGSHPHSDMSNTYLAIEALKLSEPIAQDGEFGEQPKLDWDSALNFIGQCQNLHTVSDQPNMSNDGSFIYYPGDSKAGKQKNPDGTESLRGYGSISYAGLLSMIYAEVDHEDERVKSCINWLNNNFSIDENPGLGQQGLYYYYHVMAKALAAAGIDTLTTTDGTEVDWRKELASKLVSAQREDGSWINENARWWENQAELVTCYAVLTLEQIHATIPTAGDNSTSQ